jgi:ribosomal-protein-serine acetyltransferase
MTFRRQVADGIEIRLFEDGDAEAVFATADRNRAYLREWLPWVDRTHSARDIREFITRARDKFQISRAPDAGIWIDGVFSGSIGAHNIDWANRSTSIGYWIDAAQQRRGVMTRCCVVMLDYLFHDLLLHRVEIRCGTGNTRSCAIPQRLGFLREGVLREAERVNDRWVDLVLWSMLEDAWREGAAAGRDPGSQFGTP